MGSRLWLVDSTLELPDLPGSTPLSLMLPINQGFDPISHILKYQCHLTRNAETIPTLPLSLDALILQEAWPSVGACQGWVTLNASGQWWQPYVSRPPPWGQSCEGASNITAARGSRRRESRDSIGLIRDWLLS